MKCWARWVTNWNQDCWEKYQQPQICRWYHSNGRKWRGTEEPLDEGEKAGLKLNAQKTKIMTSGPITSRISLLSNTVPRFVIAFLPRTKHLLILWLQSPSTLILELKKIQSVNVFTFPHLFLPSEWYHLHIWGCWYSSGQSWFQPVIYPAWHFTWSTLHVS